MQLVLRVQSYRGVAPLVAMAATLSQDGGTIGRAPGNDLVLDDPDKIISRSHAVIECRDGRFYFSDAGSNPSLINGRVLGSGRQALLAAGDQLMIGEYLLEVAVSTESGKASTSLLPVLDVFSPPAVAAAAVLPVFELPVSAHATPLPDRGPGRQDQAGSAVLGISAQASQPGASLVNPLMAADILNPGLLERQGELGADLLGSNLLGTIETASRFGSRPAGWLVATGSFKGSVSDHVSPEIELLSRHTVTPWPTLAIPEGYDPLSDRLPESKAMKEATDVAANPTIPGPAALVIEVDLPVSAERSAPVDAGSPDVDTPQLAEGSTAVSATKANPRKRSATRKRKPVIVAFNVEPEPEPELRPRPKPLLETPVAQTLPAFVELPVSVAAAKAPRAQKAPVVVLSPPQDLPRATLVSKALLAAPNAVAATVDAAVPASLPSDGARDDPTLQALLRGLGLRNMATGRSSTEVAYLAGVMLREATAGTMAMLMARSLTKHENRIDMTMIGSVSNNPLKFFSDADAALTEMLGSATTGYMKPVRAFCNAFDDLKAHELAVLAGMRAALSAVLMRFDPVAIEQRLHVPGVLDKVMATHRKAALWDRLVTLYADISREADDEFERLFGENFARAYREQAQRLRKNVSSNDSVARSLTKHPDQVDEKNVME